MIHSGPSPFSPEVRSTTATSSATATFSNTAHDSLLLGSGLLSPPELASTAPNPKDLTHPDDDHATNNKDSTMSSTGHSMITPISRPNSPDPASTNIDLNINTEMFNEFVPGEFNWDLPIDSDKLASHKFEPLLDILSSSPSALNNNNQTHRKPQSSGVSTPSPESGLSTPITATHSPLQFSDSPGFSAAVRSQDQCYQRRLSTVAFPPSSSSTDLESLNSIGDVVNFAEFLDINNTQASSSVQFSSDPIPIETPKIKPHSFGSKEGMISGEMSFFDLQAYNPTDPNTDVKNSIEENSNINIQEGRLMDKYFQGQFQQSTGNNSLYNDASATRIRRSIRNDSFPRFSTTPSSLSKSLIRESKLKRGIHDFSKRRTSEIDIPKSLNGTSAKLYSNDSNTGTSISNSVSNTVSNSSSNSNSANVTECSNCHTRTTPLWRRDAQGHPLCNACGLFQKLHGTTRPLSLKTDVIKKRNSRRSNSNNNLISLNNNGMESSNMMRPIPYSNDNGYSIMKSENQRMLNGGKMSLLTLSLSESQAHSQDRTSSQQPFNDYSGMNIDQNSPMFIGQRQTSLKQKNVPILPKRTPSSVSSKQIIQPQQQQQQPIDNSPFTKFTSGARVWTTIPPQSHSISSSPNINGDYMMFNSAPTGRGPFITNGSDPYSSSYFRSPESFSFSLDGFNSAHESKSREPTQTINVLAGSMGESPIPITATSRPNQKRQSLSHSRSISNSNIKGNLVNSRIAKQSQSTTNLKNHVSSPALQNLSSSFNTVTSNKSFSIKPSDLEGSRLYTVTSPSSTGDSHETNLTPTSGDNHSNATSPMGSDEKESPKSESTKLDTSEWDWLKVGL